jgi:hypothetical protein
LVALNNGPDPVSNLTLTDALPAGVLSQSLSAPAGATFTAPPVNSTGTVSFVNTGALLPGRTLTFTLTVSVPAVTGLANTATLTPMTQDANPLNNTVTLDRVAGQESQALAANSVLYHFTDPRPGATAAGTVGTVAWGEGSSNNSADGSGTVTVVANPSGGFDVVGSHTYATAGGYGLTVSVATAASAGSAAGPVHEYDGEGTTADSAGNTPGVASGNVTFVPGAVGQAFAFAGSDSQVVLGPAGFGTSDFAIDFWMKTSATDLETILGNRVDSSAGNFVSVRLVHGNLNVELDQDSQGTNYIPILSQKVVNDGAFHHVAIVHQGQVLSLYVDGTLDSSATGTGVANITNPNPLILGFERSDDVAGFNLHSFQATFHVTVTGFTINDGSAQASLVTSITIADAVPVTLDPGAYQLKW